MCINYDGEWPDATTFLQRYNRDNLFFYPTVVAAETGGRIRWAWLVPASPSQERLRDTVERLARTGERIPVADIKQAVVYPMAETTRSAEALALAARAGSEVVIRGWFKWANAQELQSVRVA